MSSNESFRYILKNSMGVINCIWFKNGLYMSMLDRKNKWGPPFLLSDNAVSDFAALIDSEDNISTCFVDYSDRLIYMTVSDEVKQPVVLLESRISGSSPYNVQLAEADGKIHIFYIVSHNRRQLLTYQAVEGSVYTMPEVEGVIIRDAKNYAICSDGVTVHMFFVTNIQNVNLLVHRKIYDGKVSRPVTTPFPYNASHRLQAVADRSGPVYVLASCDEGDENTVIFKFDTILNKFSKGFEVFNASTGQGTDSLLVIHNTPYVIRTLKNAFIVYAIDQNCSAVTEETRIDITGRDIPLKCKFQSNHKEDIYFKSDTIPMLFGSGLSFPFDIKKLAQQKHSVNNDNDVLYMRIRELENRVEFLENTIREILRP